MTILTIGEEEREQWRKDVDGVLYDDDFFGDEECAVLNARRLAYTLNVLEAAEARAEKAEAECDALAQELANTHNTDGVPERNRTKQYWLEWAEQRKKKVEALIETHLASANPVSVLGLKTVVSREPYPVELPLRDELGPVPGKPSNLKKWTVEFDMDLYAVFHGIEAKTMNEAKEIAADMLLDDPSQYLDFSNPHQFDVYEEEEEDEENET